MNVFSRLFFKVSLFVVFWTADVLAQEFPPTVTLITPKLIREGDTTNLKAEINDPDSETFTFEWRLPDGSTSSLTQPEFKATSPGANYVQLVVRDSQGNKSFPYSQIIGVHNRSPQVRNIMPLSAVEGETVNFLEKSNGLSVSPTPEPT